MKRRNEWLALLNEETAREFEGYDGDITNNLYKLNYAISRGLAHLDEVRQIEEIKNNDVYKVEGKAQDRLYSQDLVFRKAQSPAQGFWTTFDSTPGTNVAINELKLVSDNDITYTNISAVTIDGNGKGEFTVICEEYGIQGNLNIGELTRIKTPISGINTGSNTQAISGGADIENDEDYRARYLKTRLTYPGLTKSDIQAKVYEVAGYEKMYLQENETESPITLNNGLIMPPKSFVAYVKGGSDWDVAEAISLKVNTSIRMLGDVRVYVYKPILKRNEDIRFYRAIGITLYFKTYIDGTIDNGILDSFITQQLLDMDIGERVTSYKIARLVNENLNDSLVENLEIEFSTDNINFYSSLQLLTGHYISEVIKS